MTHVTCRLTAKNRDQLWNTTLGNRVWATITFYAVYLKTMPTTACGNLPAAQQDGKVVD